MWSVLQFLLRQEYPRQACVLIRVIIDRLAWFVTIKLLCRAVLATSRPIITIGYLVVYCIKLFLGYLNCHVSIKSLKLSRLGLVSACENLQRQPFHVARFGCVMESRFFAILKVVISKKTRTLGLNYRQLFIAHVKSLSKHMFSMFRYLVGLDVGLKKSLTTLI